MNAIDLFLMEHARVHAPGVAESGKSDEDGVLRGLSDEQARGRPHGLNSLVWLVWHMARAEDVAVGVVLADRRQVLDEGEWNGPMRLNRRDVGTGMTDAEVDALSEAVDLSALQAYRAAVGRRTREVAAALAPDRLEAPIDPARLRRAAEEGAFGQAAWLEQFWGSWSNGWLLSWTGAGHNFMHRGEAVVIRSLFGLRGR